MPACSGLHMDEVSTSPTITRQTTTFSSLQFKPTSDSGIASCNVHLHHLLLSKQICCLNFFVPRKDTHIMYHNQWLHWWWNPPSLVKIMKNQTTLCHANALGHSDHHYNPCSPALAAKHRWLQFWISAHKGKLPLQYSTLCYHFTRLIALDFNFISSS